MGGLPGKCPGGKGPLLSDRTDHHQGLRKAASSLATQLRSGKNGFKASPDVVAAGRNRTQGISSSFAQSYGSRD